MTGVCAYACLTCGFVEVTLGPRGDSYGDLTWRYPHLVDDPDDHSLWQFRLCSTTVLELQQADHPAVGAYALGGTEAVRAMRGGR